MSEVHSPQLSRGSPSLQTNVTLRPDNEISATWWSKKGRSMPPKLVRLCTRVRNEVKSLTIVTSLALVFIASSPMYAAPRARTGDAVLLNTSTRVFLSAALPQGRVGSSYSGTLSTRGGSAPYTFTATGSLPPGVVLNASTGAFSGTPTAPGTFYFTATVRDSRGNIGDKRLSISVVSATQVTVQISPSSSTLASGGTQQFVATVSGSSNSALATLE